MDCYTSVKAPKVSTAVILAAGHGERIQKKGKVVPKPLVKIGGLYLIERTLLTLKQAGIRSFRVVLGAHQERVQDTLAQLESLAQLDIEFVDCPDFAQGNGVSLKAGARGVTGPFLVAMGDHVVTKEVIEGLIDRAGQNPSMAHLATDDDIEGVFDLEDATKVKTNPEGQIVAIGKELEDFDSIDTGLFYFPAGAGAEIENAVNNGSTSVSGVVCARIADSGFLSAPVTEGFWQDVDTKAMAKEAERRLLKTLIKPTDGAISRYLNRTVSIAVSRVLVRFGVRPNTVTTGVFFLTLIAAALVATTEYRWIALGGLLFQLASILDGCDGEIARLTHTGTRYGAWYDTLSDNLRYGIFFGAIAVGGYWETGSELYLWALVLFSVTLVYMVSTMARYVWKTQDHLSNLAVTQKIEEKAEATPAWWERLLAPFHGLVKQDVSAFAAMTLCVIGFPRPMFWIALVGLLLMTVSVVSALNQSQAPTEEEGSNPVTFLFYVIGLSILGYLLSQTPIDPIFESLRTVGSGIFLFFLVAPFWFAANALSLSNLADNRVNFLNLYYTQFVGEAYNAVVPLAGLAGEPYKIKHLSQWLPLGDATQVIVRDRIIHAISGPLYASAVLALGLWLAPLPKTALIPLAVLAGALFVGAIILIGLMLSKLPTILSNFVLNRFSVLRPLARWERFDARRLFVSLGCKLLGRAINLVEIWVALKLLGLEGSIDQVALIAAFITMSAIFFFVIPQGLGITEAGIAGAFTLLGLAPAVGLTFGLIRRARVIFWALVGLAIHVPIVVFSRIIRPAKAIAD